MPTLPLSGGKLNTVMASFFSAVRFFASCGQGEQRHQTMHARSGKTLCVRFHGCRASTGVLELEPEFLSGSHTSQDESARDGSARTMSAYVIEKALVAGDISARVKGSMTTAPAPT